MKINQFIDHTLLKPDATYAQIHNLCQEAVENKFYAVCVNSSFVSTCSEILKEAPVHIASVIGFPLGACDTATKVFETKSAIANGADEIDMVIHIGALKSGAFDYVQKDIQQVVEAAKGAIVKVIIETSLLDNDDKKMACELSLKAGAHFVKTSTGFNGGGATIEDIKLMKSVVGDKMKIKASGGIKSFEFAKELIDLGVHRLGTSSGVALVSGEKISKEGY